MQSTLLMMILLGGLGVDNPVSGPPTASPQPEAPAVRAPASTPAPVSLPAPPQPEAPAVQAPASTAEPESPPAHVHTYAAGPDDDAMDGDSFRRCARNTFWSFFLGRDPGIATAREIEEAFYAGYPMR